MDSTIENGTLQASTATASLLSAATRLGKVGLIVSNLQRSLAFYSGVIGLQIVTRSEGFVQHCWNWNRRRVYVLSRAGAWGFTTPLCCYLSPMRDFD